MDFLFDPSLVLYLPLYQLAGASFMSRDAYGHLCTVTGALWRPKGRQFDSSDDKIDCGNTSSLNLTDEITVEVWMQSSVAGVGDVRGIVIKEGSYREPWMLYVGAPNGVRWYASQTGGAWDWAITADNVWTATEFCHIVATHHQSEGSLLYKDGVIIGSDTTEGKIKSEASAPVVISKRTQYFGGLIGEVRIYSRRLSLIEIQRNYLTTKWRYQ